MFSVVKKNVFKISIFILFSMGLIARLKTCMYNEGFIHDELKFNQDQLEGIV